VSAEGLADGTSEAADEGMRNDDEPSLAVWHWSKACEGDVSSVDQINLYSDETKGKSIKARYFFPDKFVAAIYWAQRLRGYKFSSDFVRHLLCKQCSMMCW